MSTRRKLNIELLKRLCTRFLRMRHSEHFNMKHIAIRTECGTAMCIAGHALDLQGYRKRVRSRNTRRVVYDFYTPSGKKVDPLEAAAKEIGAPYMHLHNLFHDFDITTPREAARRIQGIIDNPKSLPYYSTD